MAMLEAFLLSNELKKSTNVQEGLQRYETILKPDIASRQVQTRRIAKRFVSSSAQEMAWFRLLTRMEFSSLLVHRTANGFKGKIHQI
jgi:2-polyprenyl-6-methoxyphenol hydroxylase-like FAD-dependent oxidoreductase